MKYFDFVVQFPGGKSDHFPGSTSHFSYISGKIRSLSGDKALISLWKLTTNWWIRPAAGCQNIYFEKVLESHASSRNTKNYVFECFHMLHQGTTTQNFQTAEDRVLVSSVTLFGMITRNKKWAEVRTGGSR